MRNLANGPTANYILEESLRVEEAPSNMHLAPVIKKRLYQLMVEVAVIGEKIKSDLETRAKYAADAADLTERLRLTLAEAEYSA